MKGKDVILGLLMKQSMSGYDIKQVFESVFSYFFDASYGTIYPTLNQMGKEGLIVKETILQAGKPNKNIYSITEKGKEWFYGYLDRSIEQDVYRSDFLMRMYFGYYADEGKITEWIETAMERTKRTIDQLETDYKSWQSNMSSSQKICIEIGINTYKAQLETLQQHYKTIKHA